MHSVLARSNDNLLSSLNVSSRDKVIIVNKTNSVLGRFGFNAFCIQLNIFRFNYMISTNYSIHFNFNMI